MDKQKADLGDEKAKERVTRGGAGAGSRLPGVLGSHWSVHLHDALMGYDSTDEASVKRVEEVQRGVACYLNGTNKRCYAPNDTVVQDGAFVHHTLKTLVNRFFGEETVGGTTNIHRPWNYERLMVSGTAYHGGFCERRGVYDTLCSDLVHQRCGDHERAILNKLNVRKIRFYCEEILENNYGYCNKRIPPSVTHLSLYTYSDILLGTSPEHILRTRGQQGGPMERLVLPRSSAGDELSICEWLKKREERVTARLGKELAELRNDLNGYMDDPRV